MTHRLDVADSRELSARWCTLAEKRLDHLTELFDSGRWRRYHTESSLLENIREAKTAVTTWRALARGEVVRIRSEISLTPAVTEAASPEPSVQPEPDLAVPLEVHDEQIALVPAIDAGFAESDIALPEDIVLYQIAPAEPRIDMAALEEALNMGIASAEQLDDIELIERRYPALRYAL